MPDAIRVLHVTGGLNRAGVETWLMHVLRTIDRERFQFDFLVYGTKPYDYESEAMALGARVVRTADYRRIWAFLPQLRRVLRHGRYDVVHSHVHDFSGIVLREARRAGVPVRIAHSHLDTAMSDRAAGRARRAYLRLMRASIAANATLGLTASGAARRALFGERDHAFPVANLSYSLNLAPFRDPANRDIVRTRLGIPWDALVLGHAGRFEKQKNHAFLARIFQEAARQEPRAWFLLAGDGTLRPAVERTFSSYGISNRTTFTGSVANVARLMLGAMDVFVFPSLAEGLGLVLVEAQAAGLPCIFSDCVPEEADVVDDLVHRLPLTAPAADWARRAIAAVSAPRLSRSAAYDRVSRSPFAPAASAAALAAFYSSAPVRPQAVNA